MQNTKQVPILKSTDSKLKQVLFVAMQPDLVDLHGDVATEEEVRKACHNYNLNCNKANLFHLSDTNTFDIVESYVVPVDIQIEERFVVKGSWLVNLQVHDDDLWSAIESGEVNGVSVAALATVENLKDDE